MELGEFQKKWMQEMKEHPERQTKKMLGCTTPDGEHFYCCLGQGLVLFNEINGISTTFNSSGVLQDGTRNTTEILNHSYEKLGLRTPAGRSIRDFKIRGKKFSALADANDNGATWPEIVAIIEADPSNFFNKSV